MTDVILYLKQFLMHHRSVAIGGLGYFSKEIMSAQIHPIIHEFKPPHSLLIFEEKTTVETSSEFVEFISNITGTEIGEVQKLIVLFGNSIHEALKTTNTYEIDGFGIFKRLPDHRIDFEADETLQLNPDAFGLPVFTLTQNNTTEQKPVVQNLQTSPDIEIQDEHTPFAPIIQSDSNQESEKPEIGNTESTSLIQQVMTEKAEQKPRKKRTAILWLFIVLIFAGGIAGLYYSGYLKILYEKGLQLAQKNPTTETESPVLAISEITQETSELEEIPEQIVTDSVQSTPKDLTNEEAVPSQPTNIRYFVVADCYTYRKLAEKRVKNLESQGYHSSIAGQTKQGHFIVSYAGYADKAEAEAYLKDIKNNVNKHAWLYIK